MSAASEPIVVCPTQLSSRQRGKTLTRQRHKERWSRHIHQPRATRTVCLLFRRQADWRRASSFTHWASDTAPACCRVDKRASLRSKSRFTLGRRTTKPSFHFHNAGRIVSLETSTLSHCGSVACSQHYCWPRISVDNHSSSAAIHCTAVTLHALVSGKVNARKSDQTHSQSYMAWLLSWTPSTSCI